MLLQLKISEKIFLRDPQETELGRKIISTSIALIDDLGIEAFTFKKLSAKIDSTEASIYRSCYPRLGTYPCPSLLGISSSYSKFRIIFCLHPSNSPIHSFDIVG